MRKILALLVTLAAVFSLSLTAAAYSRHSGIFVSSKYSEAYHVLFCRDVSKIGKQRTYYTSTDAAEADGKKPCKHCGNYIRIIRGDYTGTTQERDVIDAYLEGYYAGENAGNEVGYEQGYQEGVERTETPAYERGYKDGESAAMEALEPIIKKRIKETLTTWIVLGVFGFAFVIYPGWFILVGIFELASDRIKALKTTTKAPSGNKITKPSTTEEPPKHETFACKLNADPPKPPRLGPADEEFTLIKRSSFISAVCFKGGNLYVKTTRGDYFKYYKVPRPVYLDFMNAPSMGKFYRRHISGMYPFSKL